MTFNRATTINIENSTNQALAKAEYNTGLCYANGTGVAEDQQLAFAWFEKAAKNGYALAQRELGKCYMFGRGVNKNEAHGFAWYEKAALQGDAIAQFNLGVFYNLGKGIDKNLEFSFAWSMKSAQQGYRVAEYNTGFLYENGIAVAKNQQFAFEWYKKAANHGYAMAQYALGRCYDQGKGVDKNQEQAFIWYEKAASELAEAKTSLGEKYYKGQGVEKNVVKAFDCFQQAKNAGEIVATHWCNEVLSSTADFIVKQIENSDACYIPRELPEPILQINGPYCGSSALAGALNYAKLLPFPLFASVNEKKLAINKTDENENFDIISYHLSQNVSAGFISDGPQFSVFSFNELANIYKINNCEAVLIKNKNSGDNSNCTEEEYTATLCQALNDNFAVIIACDSEHKMPSQSKGLRTHWALGLGWLQKNQEKYLVVSHHGYFCKWSLHELYESNKQLPIENPLVPGGNLSNFRFSIFKVPMNKKPEQIIQRHMLINKA